jgi:hypothetical protein
MEVVSHQHDIEELVGIVRQGIEDFRLIAVTRDADEPRLALFPGLGEDITVRLVMVILLTPPTTTCSMRAYGRLPSHHLGTRRTIPHGRVLSGVSGEIALA